MNHGEYKEHEADRLGMISSDCRLFSFYQRMQLQAAAIE